MSRTSRLSLMTASALALVLAACGNSEADSEAQDVFPASEGEAAAERNIDMDATEQYAETRLAEGEAKPNEFWWPETLNLQPLRQNEARSNPLGDDFDYASEFEKLDLAAVKSDIIDVMTTSQDWWPADYGNYGPLFIRMAWHSAGTYRTADGRGGAGGGQQRFEPLNSWPDNTNLDKARRLLWPVKQKYGNQISWADLMVLAGTVAMEQMGFETYGFAGGREDDWQAELVYWGPEQKMLARERFHGDGELRDQLAATQMGLIYVNPEGPGGNPDPKAAAEMIRTTFGRMAMNDEETVALIAGGHTFGKAHGRGTADCVGAEPAAMGVEKQGMGWDNKCGTGKGKDAFTSGLEGAWTSSPAQWTHDYLTNLFAFDWEMTKSPAGATQWQPVNADEVQIVPDAHEEGVMHAPIMFTTDLSLKEDPIYREIALRFRDNPEEFEDAFARAWFKLTHRDMGPKARYVGTEVPAEDLMWQDPVPAPDYPAINAGDVRTLKAAIMDSGLTVPQLVRTAWASASSFRDTDMRGGANGARLRLAPQNGWEVNDPQELADVVETLEGIQADFNDGSSRKVSMADLIVLGGAAAIEKAAADAGHSITVPFTPGRGDTTQEMTDAESFAPLEPKADAFRNYYADGARMDPAEAMVDRADMLSLTVPEMTALIGGMRVLGANAGDSEMGVFTDQPGTLTNDFFVNLMDLNHSWTPTDEEFVFQGTNAMTGEETWTASEVDLVFGSNSELRAVAEIYAYEDGEQRFVEDFVEAWTKVMNLDRFDRG